MGSTNRRNDEALDGATVNGLTRGNLAERTVVTLQRGSWESPDVLLVDSDHGPVVVKDFSPRRPLVANSFGRWLIGREKRALEALSGHPSVPRLLGSIDSLALVMEHRGGVRFTRRRPWTFTPEFDRKLRAAVSGLHERGVVHLDLRHRSNVRADLGGQPVLIDFDSSLTFRSGGWAARWVLPWLAEFDLYCLRKFVPEDAQTAAATQLSEVSTELPTELSTELPTALPSSSVESRGASRPMK